MRRSTFFGSLVLAAVLGALLACATVTPQELIDAREAYRNAAAGPAAQLAPAQLLDAKKALERAEREYAENPDAVETRDYAYIANRHAVLAEVTASRRHAEQEKLSAIARAKKGLEDDLSRTKEELAETKQGTAAVEAELESEKRARLEAEDQARQAESDLAQIAHVKEEARGMVISLTGSVLFASGKAELLTNASDTLDRVATALKKGMPSQSLTIEGHTDSTGSDATNDALSQRRAEAVKNYLTAQGVNVPIEAVGVGESRPIADNDTAEGRANNRRVEIIVAPYSS